MEEQGKITVQFNERGELISVDLGEGELREPTHSLFDKAPPGILKGFTDLGKLYIYDLGDGRLARCFHRRCKLF
jgi:hypothetical protein